MSHPVEKSIVCPKCGCRGTAETWPVIDVFADPAAADALLAGTLFEYPCPQCGTVFTLDFDVSYIDEYDHARIRYARRAEDRADEERLLAELPAPEKLDEDDGSPFADRIVASRDALREKAVLFRDGLDDRAVELLKASLLQMFAERGDLAGSEDVRYGGQTDEGALLIEFIDDGEVRTTEVPRSSYEALAARDLPTDTVVDARWAQKAAQKLDDSGQPA